jgi:hypothetical protein
LKKIDFEEVSAPNVPARITQARKNRAMFPAHTGFPINKDQIRPAARNPLYSPWFAASTFVLSKSAGSMDVNIRFPVVVHANISTHKMYKCSAAINATRIPVSKFNVTPPE